MTKKSDDQKNSKPLVGLFITCLVDLMRPSVGFATVELLEQAGCRVEVPEEQTCCGKPGYNSGDLANARDVAKRVIEIFEPYDYVVVPSGSCAGMISRHYPKLLAGIPRWENRAEVLAEKCFELTGFLTDVMGFTAPAPLSDLSGRTFTYHDTCTGLREMRVKAQPRQLLRNLRNVEITEMKGTEECCGFGGTFAAKMPDISRHMVDAKIRRAEDAGAQIILGGDMGCLMNIAGRMKRLGKDIEVRHVAEVLAGRLDIPAINGKGE